jgi:glycoprotein-N-acetylgalactosamine 3-beta-galactosyltransferase
MVLTTPVNYLTKAVHVQATWGRRCDTLLFISNSERGLLSWFITPKVVTDLPDRELTGVEGREYLWDNVKNGLSIVWRDYRDQFDFLIKADDDTFLIVDNLKHLLSKRSPDDPFILGHHQEDRSVAYMSGGSGYVLSHAAVKDIVEVGFSGHQPCHLPHLWAKRSKCILMKIYRWANVQQFSILDSNPVKSKVAVHSYHFQYSSTSCLVCHLPGG